MTQIAYLRSRIEKADDWRDSKVPTAVAGGASLAGAGAAAHHWRAGKKAGKEYGKVSTERANFDAGEHQKLMAAHEKNKDLFRDTHADSAELRRVRAQGDDLRTRLSRGTRAREKAATKMSAGPSMAAEMLNSRLTQAQHQLHHASDRPQFGTKRHTDLDNEVQDLYHKRGNLRRAFQHAGDNKKARPQVHQSNLSTARIMDDIQDARKHRASNAFVAATDARLGRVIDTKAMQEASEKARKPLVAAEAKAERKVMRHARSVAGGGGLAVAGLGGGVGGALALRARKKKANVEKYLVSRVEKAVQRDREGQETEASAGGFKGAGKLKMTHKFHALSEKEKKRRHKED